MKKNSINHFMRICAHKHYVRQYCWKIGLYKQGLLHDMSKFSPVEFLESIRYYNEVGSPINACKAEQGYSLAWFHHKGRNPHHAEYWMDGGMSEDFMPIMPYKYAAEMVCDFLGAAKAYDRENFTYSAEYDWWMAHRDFKAMHPVIKTFVTNIFAALKRAENAKEWDVGIVKEEDIFTEMFFELQYYAEKEKYKRVREDMMRRSR